MSPVVESKKKKTRGANPQALLFKSHQEWAWKSLVSSGEAIYPKLTACPLSSDSTAANVASVTACKVL